MLELLDAGPDVGLTGARTGHADAQARGHVARQQEGPIEMSADRKEEGGLVTLRFLGKYEASFMVTDPDQS